MMSRGEMTSDKWMKTAKRILLFILTVMFVIACDDIGREERLIYEKPEPSKRVVLLEDFTGQRCVNCPKATEVIEQLQREYGEALIAVAIHGGPLGFHGSSTVAGLATDVGDEYFEHWGLEFQPVGLVNRRSPKSYPEWAAAVKEELAIPTTLTLGGQAKIEGDDILITVNAQGTDGDTSGKIQLWLVEDSIIALQMMPDGTLNREYIHNHVLRTPVNGNWGENFTIKEGEAKALSYSQPLNADWNTARLRIVAFVYNESGVFQTIILKVDNNNNTKTL